MNTTIIAEIGSCHENSILKAKSLIENAKECGANISKFQYWSDSTELARKRNASELAEKYEAFRLPKEWLPDLKTHCDHVGIEFMCTCYLEQDIETINPYVDRFKISSFEAHDRAFLKKHEKHQKPILVSCGMGGGIDVTGVAVILLHCVTAYPTPISQLNIGTIVHHPYGGFSDHSVSVQTGAWAAIAGAKYVEKHIRSKDTADTNPDCGHSLVCDTEASSFEIYCTLIRDAEKAMGDGYDKVQECEKVNLPYRRITIG